MVDQILEKDHSRRWVMGVLDEKGRAMAARLREAVNVKAEAEKIIKYLSTHYGQ